MFYIDFVFLIQIYNNLLIFVKTLGCGKHGKCIGPNNCACEIGWRGLQCDECVPLPGCVNGKCVKNPFECICDDPMLWNGALCNSRKKNLHHNKQ